MDHLLVQNPDLKQVVTEDGAKDNVEVLDFWHAAEYLKTAADAAFGSDEKASTNWFEAKRHILRHDPKGFSKRLIHFVQTGLDINDMFSLVSQETFRETENIFDLKH